MRRVKGQKITRNDFIHREIHAWLIQQGRTLGDIAQDLGRHQSTLANFVRGLTQSPELKNYFIQVMGYSAWEKFPPVEYVPPNQTETAA